MNKLINGGNVWVGWAYDYPNSLRMESDPDKPLVPAETCEFDYTAFCNLHSKVTASLQAVFDKIVANLKPEAATEAQVEELKPARRLSCASRDYEISELINRGVHGAILAEAVEDATGVIVTAMRASAYSYYYNVSFDYEIPTDTDELSQICRNQLLTEKIIRNIKRNKYRYIARWVADWLLYQDMRRRESDNDPMLLGSLLIPLNRQYKGYWVDLRVALSLDDQFASKIASEVERYTEGLIKIDIEPYKHVRATIGRQELTIPLAKKAPNKAANRDKMTKVVEYVRSEPV